MISVFTNFRTINFEIILNDTVSNIWIKERDFYFKNSIWLFELRTATCWNLIQKIFTLFAVTFLSINFSFLNLLSKYFKVLKETVFKMCSKCSVKVLKKFKKKGSNSFILNGLFLFKYFKFYFLTF